MLVQGEWGRCVFVFDCGHPAYVRKFYKVIFLANYFNQLTLIIMIKKIVVASVN